MRVVVVVRVRYSSTEWSLREVTALVNSRRLSTMLSCTVLNRRTFWMGAECCVCVGGRGGVCECVRACVCMCVCVGGLSVCGVWGGHSVSVYGVCVCV